MTDSTGIYIIMFKVFFDQTLYYIILIVLLMLFAAGFFRIVGGLNTKPTENYDGSFTLKPAPFSSWLESI